MITFQNYDHIIKNIYAHNQEHIFNFWNELTDLEKKDFLEQLKQIDFDLLNKLFASTKEKQENATNYYPAEYIPISVINQQKKPHSAIEKLGIESIKNGKVAAFVVAGGQGSRLDFDGPKGAYLASPCKNKSLFQIFSEKILYWSKKFNVSIPFFIMTSQLNHDQTYSFFKENNFFGLAEGDVYLFSQNMIPSLDVNGKLILAEKNKIFTNPDGHGGSLTALESSGMLDIMEKRGIEIISYFQIDNPLINIIDPIFIGYHIKNKSEVSSKTILKNHPEEKIGVFVEYPDKNSGVIEYSDLPDDKMHLKDDKGNYVFSAGSIAIHLFDRLFLEKITSDSTISLEYHIANKKIKSYTKTGIQEIDGFKFEKFVFDTLPLAKNSIIIETIREHEFGPIKNKTGVDSVETSEELMINLYKNWLIENGITIPEKVKKIEISPLKAASAVDLDSSVKIPNQENVYIE